MTITSGYESKQCLQSANIQADQDHTADELPRAKAWRIGGGRIAWTCPRCGGLHLSGEPVAGADDGVRVGFCMSAFESTDIGSEFYLDVQPGRPPSNVEAAIKRGYPLADLAAAFDAISGGREISASKFASHGEDDEEDFWKPSKGEFLAALKALADCGAMEEALAFRAELGQLTGRQLWRCAAADFLRQQPGRSWRERLLTALRECWLRHGGPA